MGREEGVLVAVRGEGMCGEESRSGMCVHGEAVMMRKMDDGVYVCTAGSVGSGGKGRGRASGREETAGMALVCDRTQCWGEAACGLCGL